MGELLDKVVNRMEREREQAEGDARIKAESERKHGRPCELVRLNGGDLIIVVGGMRKSRQVRLGLHKQE